MYEHLAHAHSLIAGNTGEKLYTRIRAPPEGPNGKRVSSAQACLGESHVQDESVMTPWICVCTTTGHCVDCDAYTQA